MYECICIYIFIYKGVYIYVHVFMCIYITTDAFTYYGAPSIVAATMDALGIQVAGFQLWLSLFGPHKHKHTHTLMHTHTRTHTHTLLSLFSLTRSLYL